MLVDAVAALVFGWMFDMVGIKSLMISTVFSAFFCDLYFYRDVKGSYLFRRCIMGNRDGSTGIYIKINR